MKYFSILIGFWMTASAFALQPVTFTQPTNMQYCEGIDTLTKLLNDGAKMWPIERWAIENYQNLGKLDALTATMLIKTPNRLTVAHPTTRTVGGQQVKLFTIVNPSTPNWEGAYIFSGPEKYAPLTVSFTTAGICPYIRRTGDISKAVEAALKDWIKLENTDDNKKPPEHPPST